MQRNANQQLNIFSSVTNHNFANKSTTPYISTSSNYSSASSSSNIIQFLREKHKNTINKKDKTNPNKTRAFKQWYSNNRERKRKTYYENGKQTGPNFKKCVKACIRAYSDYKLLHNEYSDNKSIHLSVLGSLMIYFFDFLFVESKHDQNTLYIYEDGVYSDSAITKINKIASLCIKDFQSYQISNLLRYIYSRVQSYSPNTLKSKINSQNYLINCENAIYNRRTNHIMKHSPKYFFTNEIHTYLPSKRELNNFIYKVPLGKQKKVRGKLSTDISRVPNSILNMTIPQYIDTLFNELSSNISNTKLILKEEIVDALESHLSHGQFIINYGETHTGKSDFQNLIRAVANMRIASIPINKLHDPRQLASAYDSLAVITDDMGEQVTIKDSDIANIKSFVRGETVQIKFNYKNYQTVQLHDALIMGANSLPKFKDMGPQIENRVRIVHFKHQFNENSSNYLDDDLFLKLITTPELRSYVLWWALMTTPRFTNYANTQSSKLLYNQSQINSNPIQQFVDRIASMPLNRVPMTYLYQCFKQFADNRNYHKINYTDFRTQLFAVLKSQHVDYRTSTERYSKNQVFNLYVLIRYLQVRPRITNTRGDVTLKTLINVPKPNSRTRSLVLPNIDSSITYGYTNGILYHYDLNTEIKFPHIKLSKYLKPTFIIESAKALNIKPVKRLIKLIKLSNKDANFDFKHYVKYDAYKIELLRKWSSYINRAYPIYERNAKARIAENSIRISKQIKHKKGEQAKRHMTKQVHYNLTHKNKIKAKERAKERKDADNVKSYIQKCCKDNLNVRTSKGYYIAINGCLDDIFNGFSIGISTNLSLKQYCNIEHVALNKYDVKTLTKYIYKIWLKNYGEK